MFYFLKIEVQSIGKGRHDVFRRFNVKINCLSKKSLDIGIVQRIYTIKLSELRQSIWMFKKEKSQ